MSKIAEAIALTDHLSGLHRQKAVLLDKLAMSLALQDFEPRAFQGGACRVAGSSNRHNPWDGTITIHLPTGEDVAHKAIDVPFKLWPAAMQAELHAIAANKRPKQLRGL